MDTTTLGPLTLTLTQFQRSFKKARAQADKGASVIINGGGKQYIFEEYVEKENPFEGMEDIFGPARRISELNPNGKTAKKSHR